MTTGQSEPAESFVLKLERAQEHLETLSRELNEFLKDDPQPIVRRVDGQRVEFVAEVREPFPPRLALLAGDVLQNARSALDHVVWRLAGDKASSESSFPLYSDIAAYRAVVHRKLKGVGDPARGIIEGLQPYNGTDQGKALGLLHDLARKDRHRDLHVLGGVSNETKIQVGNSGADGRPRFIEVPKGDIDWEVHFGTFAHGTVLASFVCPPGVDVECDFVRYVAISDSSPDTAAYPMLLSLDGMIRAIRQEVLPPLVPHLKPRARPFWADHQLQIEQRFDVRVDGHRVDVRVDKPTGPSKI